MEPWISWLVFSLGMVSLVAAQWGHAGAVKVNKETRELLDDIRQCNSEFEEAVRLYEYGAVEEAIEMSQRWQKRLGCENQ